MLLPDALLRNQQELKCMFPRLVTGNIGPTKSTATCLNSVSIRGMEPNINFVFFPFGTVRWQMTQDLQYL